MKEIRYDKDADALIIVFSDEKVAYEEEINEDELIVSFSENRELIWLGVENYHSTFSLVQFRSDLEVSIVNKLMNGCESSEK